MAKGAVTPGNFSCNLSRNFVAALRHKLHESLSRDIFVVVTVERSRTDFYFSQLLRQHKNCETCSLQGMLHRGNDSCNLCRNKIARQVARKIAQCNSALRRQRKEEKKNNENESNGTEHEKSKSRSGCSFCFEWCTYMKQEMVVKITERNHLTNKAIW